jgi:hypothetical protein
MSLTRQRWQRHRRATLHRSPNKNKMNIENKEEKIIRLLETIEKQNIDITKNQYKLKDEIKELKTLVSRIIPSE